MMTEQERIELAKLQVKYYQSIVDGKPIVIEGRITGNKDKWVEIKNPNWYEDIEYREKPKPIEMWMVFDEKDALWATCYSQEQADGVLERNGTRKKLRIVHMKEVVK